MKKKSSSVSTQLGRIIIKNRQREGRMRDIRRTHTLKIHCKTDQDIGEKHDRSFHDLGVTKTDRSTLLNCITFVDRTYFEAVKLRFVGQEV